MDFTVPVDSKVKIIESKKSKKFLDLARKIKKLKNMGLTVMLFVVGTFETVPKSLKRGKELEIRVLV